MIRVEVAAPVEVVVEQAASSMPIELSTGWGTHGQSMRAILCAKLVAQVWEAALAVWLLLLHLYTILLLRFGLHHSNRCTHDPLLRTIEADDPYLFRAENISCTGRAHNSND